MALAYLIDGARFKVGMEPGIVKGDVFKALQDARSLLLECQAAGEMERQRGFDQGLKEAQAQHAELLARAHANAAAYLNALDGKVIDLVVQALRRIAPRIGASTIVPELVEQALGQIQAERTLIVRVHPQCREGVSSRLLEACKGHPAAGFFEVHADESLDPFACTLESELGIVRADLELQIQAVERALRDSLGSNIRSS